MFMSFCVRCGRTAVFVCFCGRLAAVLSGHGWLFGGRRGAAMFCGDCQHGC